MVNPANKPGCYALFGNSGIKLYKDANHDADNLISPLYTQEALIKTKTSLHIKL